MKTRPILFSGPMVRAILDGRKTQTRRVVKPIPPDWINDFGYTCFTKLGHISGRGPYEDNFGEKFYKCPYGQAGRDRLWVRETWKLWEREDGKDFVVFNADGKMKPFPNDPNLEYCATAWDGKWHPSIHMSKWMSRINLEITDVRVERVQDISEDDAIAEGSQIPCDQLPKSCQQGTMTERTQFSRIWDSINGKTYPWESNPWVWVVTFNMV